MDSGEQAAAALFMAVLQLDRLDAQAFAQAGFTCLEDIAYVPWDEYLEERSSIDEAVLRQARERARRILDGDR